jgi:hypothetical protein
MVRVNLDPVIVAGTDETALERGVDRVLAIVRGQTNCLIGTGALPYETPIENIQRIRAHLARVERGAHDGTGA